MGDTCSGLGVIEMYTTCDCSERDAPAPTTGVPSLELGTVSGGREEAFDTEAASSGVVVGVLDAETDKAGVLRAVPKPTEPTPLDASGVVATTSAGGVSCAETYIAGSDRMNNTVR
jgi:hypothetical protein